MKRTASFIERTAKKTQAERLQQLTSVLPERLAGRVAKYRYVLLALLLNTPGNSILGGAGGIAFASGLAGVFGFWGFFLTALAAVAPIPLFFVLMG